MGMNKVKIAIRLLPLAFIAILVACADNDSAQQKSKEQNNEIANVYTLVEKPSSIKEAERLGQWFPASDFDALGIYLPPGQPIEIGVNNLRGSTQPKLLVGTYSRYLAEDEPTVHDLVAGQNSITDKTGGLLYLQYVTEGVATGKVEVTVKGGEPIPVYTLGETSHEDWLHMLSSMSYDDVLFVSNRTMVVVSKETALNFKDLSQDEMLRTLDRISDIEDYISGIDGSSDLHKPNVHKLLITETADTDYFLAAEEHRVLVISSACNKFMDPNEAATEAWGIWHEMGHMRQTVNWDWDEVDEVTVNIYSLAAKRGLKSNKIWLEGNEVWDMLDDYFKIPLQDRIYNTSKMLKGKGRLAMFQQLWLAYGDEFYIKVHRLTREEKAETPETEHKMAYFILVSSKASGYNLKDFFTEWGFKIHQKHFDALDALNLPKPTIDLLALRE